MEEKINTLEVLYDDKNIIDGDNRYEVENDEFKSPAVIKTKRKSKNHPFIFFLFIFILIAVIGFAFFLLIEFIKNENETFYQSLDEPFNKPLVSQHKYRKIIFNNGLELLLVQVDENDTAGGAIVIDSGYNDLNFPRGDLRFSLYSLVNKEILNSSRLSDYFGEFNYYVEDFYSYYRFQILNDGFFNYLYNFSSIFKNSSLNQIKQDYKSVSVQMEKNYINELKETERKEQYLINYLIYGYKNDSGDDDYRAGRIKDYINRKDEDNEKTVRKTLNKLMKPSKIKIVLMSHFKISRMEAKFKNYFNYLIKLNGSEQSNSDNEIIFDGNKFSKQKIISYVNKRKSYIKINYYIDKLDDESYNDFVINAGYFNYLKYILDGNKEVLKNSSNNFYFDFKSLSCDFEVILKSKIKFSITIELYSNSYPHFQDILYNIYHYIYNVTKYVKNINEENQNYKELKKILNQSFIFQEDSDVSIDVSYDFARRLFQKKFNESFYFLKNKWIPSPFDFEKFKKYYEKLTPENSVIIFGMIGNETYNEKCSNDHTFKLNCTKLFFQKFHGIHTNYFNLYYAMDDLDIGFSENFNSTEGTINFQANEYISGYIDKIPKDPEDENNNVLAFRIGNETSNMRHFYLKKDTSFGIPKIHLSLNFFHPYLRPGDEFPKEFLINNNATLTKYCKYFLLMLYWTFIKKEIKENLNDAIRAGNSITVGYNDNNLFVEIFAYSDKIEEILKKIKNIVLSTEKLDNGEFIKNSKLYNESLFEDFLNFGGISYLDLTLFDFYNRLANERMFNKYLFVKEFDESIYNNSIHSINSSFESNNFGMVITNYIINAQIYGNCTKEKADIIANIFKEGKNDENNFNLYDLQEAGYNNEIKAYNFVNYIRNITVLNYSTSVDNIRDRDNKTSKFTRYLFYEKYSLNNYIKISLLSKMLSGEKLSLNGYTIETKEFLHNAAYLRFTLKKNNNESLDKLETLLTTLKDVILIQKDKYSEELDVIGNRFYYLKKNLENYLTVKRDNMVKRAYYFLNSLVYSNDVGTKSIHELISDIELNNIIDSLERLINETFYIDYFYDHSQIK